MSKIEQVISTAKTHLEAKRERGETLTPDESGVMDFIDWAEKPGTRYYYSNFTAFETKQRADRSEKLIKDYKNREGCSYREAVLAASKQYPHLVR